jgi:hypothetical protein
VELPEQKSVGRLKDRDPLSERRQRASHREETQILSPAAQQLAHSLPVRLLETDSDSEIQRQGQRERGRERDKERGRQRQTETETETSKENRQRQRQIQLTETETEVETDRDCPFRAAPPCLPARRTMVTTCACVRN